MSLLYNTHRHACPRQNDVARPDESVRQPDKSVLAGTGRAGAKRSGGPARIGTGGDDVLQNLLS